MKIVDLRELDNAIFKNEDERIAFERAYSHYIKFFEELDDTHICHSVIFEKTPNQSKRIQLEQFRLKMSYRIYSMKKLLEDFKK